MNNIRQRLIDIAKYKGVSVRAFEELCGLNRGNISNLAINGNIGSDKLSKIIDAIPEIDSEWLLTGRGKMLAEGIQRGWPISQLDNNTEIEMRPRIPLDAAAGSLSIMAESVSDAECERDRKSVV